MSKLVASKGYFGESPTFHVVVQKVWRNGKRLPKQVAGIEKKQRKMCLKDGSGGDTTQRSPLYHHYYGGKEEGMERWVVGVYGRTSLKFISKVFI